MKKLTLTIAIVLGLSMTTFAEGNQGGGLFRRGATPEQKTTRDNGPLLPLQHGATTNADADPQAPVGSGIAVLAVLGGAYLLGKKRREE